MVYLCIKDCKANVKSEPKAQSTKNSKDLISDTSTSVTASTISTVSNANWTWENLASKDPYMIYFNVISY